MEAYFKSKIRDVHDFPKDGIVFKDITTLLKDPDALQKMGDALYEQAKDLGVEKVVGIDSRGFIFGGYLAIRLNAGLVLVRKHGKLPADTHQQTYELEYGQDVLEIHRDALKPGERVLLHDDLLATGGTARAACDLIEKAGGEVVLASFLIELIFLKGREKFNNYEVASVVAYDAE
jgi:adenine phosphoribosyltransferase